MKRGLVTSSNYQVVAEPGAVEPTQRDGALPGLTPGESVGIRVAAHLHGLLQGAPMYQPADPQWRAHAGRFTAAMQHAFEVGQTDAVRIFFFGKHVYVNGRPVRAEARLAVKTAWLLETMHRMGIADIRFANPLSEEDVAQFLSHIQSVDRFGAGGRDLSLASIEVRVGRTSPAHEALLAQLRQTSRFGVLEFYADALATTRVWARDLATGRHPDPVAARRLGARLLDTYHTDPSGLLGMLCLRPIAGSFATRRLDTTIAVVAIAVELGFDDAEALDFAVASLLRRVPSGWGVWWTRPPADPAEVARRAFEADTTLEKVVSFESGAPVGLSIPAEYYGRVMQPHAATMVLNVAGGLVDLLQPGDASNPFAPEAAVQMMLAQSGRFFEPSIVAALVQALGVWPPGSIVRLNSADIAVVVRRAEPGVPPNRPFIRPIEAGAATGVYDLSQPELAAYRIVGSAQPTECAVNPMFAFVL